ncbi:MAG TPA: thiamine pyrophosphate-dependent enzyme [Candidatus Dormibacteraeota bacterium]|nr:thiamine pyrophosphate-dependent enzyme [Candidatus Dormibacteraeota bacterium]
MAGKTAAELMVERLADVGVDTVFGLPGDGINGVMEALRKNQDRIHFVHVRHEESAAFAACAYAKYTGRLGVCVATSGPGAVHLLNGLYDAKLDQAPVLAITGMTYHDLIGTMYQQDVNTDYLFQDVAVFNQRVMGPAHVSGLVDLAVRTALARRGVAHITFPLDLQEWTMGDDERSKRNVARHSSVPPLRSVRTPPAVEVERAATILRGKRRIAIVAGNGARGAGELLEQLADRLGAPIIKPLLGKDVVPDDSPYVTGGVGMLGSRASQDALAGCDALVMIASSFPYMEFLPKPGQAVVVQIDDDPARIGLRMPADVGLVGDARATLEMLLPHIETNPDRSFLEEAQRNAADWWDLMKERGSQQATPMKPQVVAWQLNEVLAEDAIISGDAGTVALWAGQMLRIKRGQRFSLSGTLASMASGLPYAIAAQIAHPHRQCVAFVGDGGLEMLMADFATCVQYGLPVKVIVLKNNVLGMIKWEQMVFLGNPEYGVDMTPIDFVKFAEACGGRGFRIGDPQLCRDQLRDALATDGPVIVEAIIDPYEAPITPKIKPEEAVHMAEALARGEPNRERVALTMFRESVKEAPYPASPFGVFARMAAKFGRNRKRKPEVAS